MTPDARRDREDQISQAAYRLLEERGYAGISMLAIAKSAKASNETLYRWYGDKAGLFLALVKRNAEEAQDILAQFQERNSLREVLEELGPVLLDIVTGPRAVALNRAAAADASGALGQAIADGGRNAVFPRLVEVFRAAQQRNEIRQEDLSIMVTDYFGVLIGDLQIRRVIGVVDPLTPNARIERSSRAIDMFLQLYGV